MFGIHVVGWSSVGVQTRNGTVLKELLRPGIHLTGAAVTSIALKQTLLRSLDNKGPWRIRVKYELDPEQLLPLYEDPAWLPVRASQIPELASNVGLQVLREALSSLVRHTVPDDDEQDGRQQVYWREYDFLPESDRLSLLNQVEEEFRNRLDNLHPGVFSSAGVFVNRPKT